MSYDSRPDTHEHIGQVRGLLLGVAHDLTERAHRHDRSKLEEPERTVFDRVTPHLADSTYGSDEYKGFLADMGEGLKHHYAVNDHHPEYFNGGIAEMNLIQLTEMLCDWIAATRRHDDGDIHRSIDQNAERFDYGEDLARLLHRTVDALLERELAAWVERLQLQPGDLAVLTFEDRLSAEQVERVRERAERHLHGARVVVLERAELKHVSRVEMHCAEGHSIEPGAWLNGPLLDCGCPVHRVELVRPVEDTFPRRAPSLQ